MEFLYPPYTTCWILEATESKCDFGISSLQFFDAICFYFLELPTSCCISRKENSPLVKVTERGITWLIDYTKLRGNYLAEQLASKVAVNVCEKCRRQYNNKRWIEQKQKYNIKPSELKIECQRSLTLLWKGKGRDC